MPRVWGGIACSKERTAASAVTRQGFGETVRFEVPVGAVSKHAKELYQVRQPLHLLHGLGQIGEAGLGVAIEHAGNGLKEERVLQSGKAFAFAALEYNH